MTRKRHERYQHRFDLLRDDAQHQRLHEYLDKLSEHGKAGDWIIKTLLLELDKGTRAEPDKDKTS